MAALARQVLWRNRLSLQPVRETHRHRQGFFGRALIGDLRAVGVPYDHIVRHAGIALISADVFNVLKAADIGDLVTSFIIVQPFTDRNAVGISLGVREHIDGLLLVLRHGGHSHPAEHGQYDERGDTAHSFAFHKNKASVILTIFDHATASSRRRGGVFIAHSATQKLRTPCDRSVTPATWTIVRVC